MSSASSKETNKAEKYIPVVKSRLYAEPSNIFNSSFVSFPTFHDEKIPVIGHSLISSDSGLSSTRIDTESEVAESEVLEMNGLKKRLIEETEGALTTRLLYHYNDEKFIVRVPGRPPTLQTFRAKIHLRGQFRYFFKNADDFWVEITDGTEPLPVRNETVEAKVISA